MPRILGRRRHAGIGETIGDTIDDTIDEAIDEAIVEGDERSRAARSSFVITPQQAMFFDTFGFLVLPKLFGDDMPRIQAGFEEVFARDAAQPLDPENPFHRTDDPRYQQETRWIIPAFVDRSVDLAWLRDDARMDSIARGLLGDDYAYAESDGNLFNCNVYWHIDAYGATADARHIKIFFYLDALRHDAGALRLVPGSHLRGEYTAALYRLMKDPTHLPGMVGIRPDDIPSWTFEAEPGDVLVTDFRTFHASFKGGVRRRLFTVNFRAGTDAERA